MDLNQLRKEHRQKILHLAAQYGARQIRIFGSVARGQADAQSDVDFLVDMEPGRSLMDMGGLQMGLQELLGCTVDIVSVKGLRARMKDRILEEAVLL
ncbi:MAG: nucleotidyltransferase [Candidatus Latescibacteria bacterium]|nr:nucleotidyltransferase [Candidatus Latescibacterota bacterium]